MNQSVSVLAQRITQESLTSLVPVSKSPSHTDFLSDRRREGLHHPLGGRGFSRECWPCRPEGNILEDDGDVYPWEPDKDRGETQDHLQVVDLPTYGKRRRAAG